MPDVLDDPSLEKTDWKKQWQILRRRRWFLRHGLPVIEDAACAVGSEYCGRRIGAPLGELACFSFHPRKILFFSDRSTKFTHLRMKL